MDRVSEAVPVATPKGGPQQNVGLKLGIFLALLFGGFGILMYFGIRTELEGSLRIARPDAAEHVFTPSACRNEMGYGRGYMVVHFRDEAGWQLYLQPGQAELVTPERESIVLTPSDCATFDVDVEVGEGAVDKIEQMDGHVRVECRSRERTVEGSITFDGCSS